MVTYDQLVLSGDLVILPYGKKENLNCTIITLVTSSYHYLAVQ